MRFIRPLSTLGDEIRSRTEKIHFGVAPVDRKLRGLRVGEFAIIAGLPHHGKSLLAQTMVLNNPAVPILWVSPDESRAKVLGQLAAAALGRSYQDDIEPILEMRTADDRPAPECEEMLEELTEVVRREYPLFTVVGGERLGITELGIACDESAEITGQQPRVLVYDYLRQLPVPPRSDQPGWRSEALKAFGYKAGVAVVAIHQVRRLQSPKDALWPAPDMLSYEGEKEAFQILWCTREALVDPQNTDAVAEDRQPSVRVFIIKNKSGKLLLDGVNCAINPESGLVEEWTHAHTQRRRGTHVHSRYEDDDDEGRW